MAISKLSIGTRGSNLALKQTELVADALQSLNPDIEIETKIIITKGDEDLSPIPLDVIGKAWFTKELEEAILRNEIDLAVHSLKDLPPNIPDGLKMAPILERDDPRDVLISKAGQLKDLPRGAVVGTDSIRRKALLLERRSDLVIKSVRGNIETRLRKLKDEDYSALVLAAAGLKRIGLTDIVTEYFDPSVFIPAIGQGVLAVEAKENNEKLWSLIKLIQHPLTLQAATAELKFSEIIGGGCKLPIGCYADIRGGVITLHAMLGSLDGLKTMTKSVRGPESEAINLVESLAEEMKRSPIFSKQ